MKRTIATGSAKTAKTIATAMAALALLPAGAHADLMFEHGGPHLQVSGVPRQLARRERLPQRP